MTLTPRETEDETEVWAYTPEEVVTCWQGSFDGDDTEMRTIQLEELAATVDHCFNIADHDMDIYSILNDAVRHAGEFIASLPCECTDDEPCRRCLALGRYFNKRNER